MLGVTLHVQQLLAVLHTRLLVSHAFWNLASMGYTQIGHIIHFYPPHHLTSLTQERTFLFLGTQRLPVKLRRIRLIQQPVSLCVISVVPALLLRLTRHLRLMDVRFIRIPQILSRALTTLIFFASLFRDTIHFRILHSRIMSSLRFLGMSLIAMKHVVHFPDVLGTSLELLRRASFPR